MEDSKPSFWQRLLPVSSSLSAFFPHLVTGKVWDREYARGAWDVLLDDDQLGHNMIVLGYVMKAPRNADILEVGCGAGRLLDLIKRIEFGSYLGVDISAEAIDRAKALCVERAAFEVADATLFGTDRKFDVVVFNEIAYYFQKPEEVISRYVGQLKEDGFMVVSMVEFPPSRWIWRRLDEIFETVNMARVQQKRLKWQTRWLKPRRS